MLGAKWGKVSLLNKKTKQIEDALKYQVEVGFFESSKYPDGTPVAQIAYANENGAFGNPRRPFMHRTFDKNRDKWVRGIASNLKGHLEESAVRRAFEQAGMVAQGDMKRTVMDWNPSDPRANSPAAIKAKRRGGNNNPNRALVDTGMMVNSISYEVKKK